MADQSKYTQAWLDQYDDPDDLHDALEALLQLEIQQVQSQTLPLPALDADHLLAMANLLIPLRQLWQFLQQAFQQLDQELDTGSLQRQAQPLEAQMQALRENLQQSHEMVYLLAEIKTLRKQAKRLSRQVQRVQSLEAYRELEQAADQQVGGTHFGPQIEEHRLKGRDVSMLLAAQKQMEDRIDKMRDAFDTTLERLKQAV